MTCHGRLAATTDGLRLVAVGWVGAARVGLWVLSPASVRRLLDRAARRLPRRRTQRPSPLAVGRAVHAAARAVPSASCLVEAVAAEVMLSRAGYAPAIHLGAARASSHELRAHAWVEVDGTVVVGGGAGRHTPIGSV